jgi:hypothetical protein
VGIYIMCATSLTHFYAVTSFRPLVASRHVRLELLYKRGALRLPLTSCTMTSTAIVHNGYLEPSLHPRSRHG